MIYHLSLSPNAETDLLEISTMVRKPTNGLGGKFTKKVEAYLSRIQIPLCSFL